MTPQRNAKPEVSGEAARRPGRREFLRTLRNLTLGTSAYSLLAAIIAEEAWAGRPNCPDPHQCPGTYYWYCNPPDEYYEPECAPLPKHYCATGFTCQDEVWCYNDFYCNGKENAYGCTGRKFVCDSVFSCKLAGDEFNCTSEDTFHCIPGAGGFTDGCT